MADPVHAYVSRGGLKLAAALEAFALDPRGRSCADLGSNVGGFVDCLLQRGAARVYAVDTGYGTLAWKLRQDPRVIVCERTNAIHVDPRDAQAMPRLAPFEGVDLVTVDLGWTRQALAIPAALRWLRRAAASEPATPPLPSGERAGVRGETTETTDASNPSTAVTARIITLIKPHYEATREELAGAERGVLSVQAAAAITQRVLAAMPSLGVTVHSHILSPIRGGASRGREGNVEYLALVAPTMP